MSDAPDHDVVVIGSGPGGGACAWGLAARGLKVLLLEEGPSYDPFADYRLDQPGWEQSRFPAKIPIDGRQTFAPMQPLEERWRDLRSWNRNRGLMLPGDRRQAVAYYHVVGLGGTTLHFTGEAHRLNRAAMAMQSRFGVAADWPFDYDALEPYYETAERIMGVAGPPQADRHRPRRSPYPLPPHPAELCQPKARRRLCRAGAVLRAQRARRALGCL